MALDEFAEEVEARFGFVRELLDLLDVPPGEIILPDERMMERLNTEIRQLGDIGASYKAPDGTFTSAAPRTPGVRGA